MTVATRADELLKKLILKRLGEHYAQFPHSVHAHILACPTLAVRDITHQDTFSCCESCPYVEFAAVVSCEHAQVEFTYGEAGRLDSVLADLAELDDEGRAA